MTFDSINSINIVQMISIKLLSSYVYPESTQCKNK